MKKLLFLTTILMSAVCSFAEDFTYTKNPDGTVTKSRVVSADETDQILKALEQKKAGLQTTIATYLELAANFQDDVDLINAEIAKITAAKEEIK